MELFTLQGQLIARIPYNHNQLVQGDGITIDGNDNTIIADQGARVIVIFNRFNMLVRTIPRLSLPVDVALCFHCKCLIVADFDSGLILM